MESKLQVASPVHVGFYHLSEGKSSYLSWVDSTSGVVWIEHFAESSIMCIQAYCCRTASCAVYFLRTNWYLACCPKMPYMHYCINYVTLLFVLFTGLVDQISEFRAIPSDLLPVPHGGYTVYDGMYYMSHNPNSPQVFTPCTVFRTDCLTPHLYQSLSNCSNFPLIIFTYKEWNIYPATLF